MIKGVSFLGMLVGEEGVVGKPVKQQLVLQECLSWACKMGWTGPGIMKRKATVGARNGTKRDRECGNNGLTHFPVGLGPLCPNQLGNDLKKKGDRTHDYKSPEYQE